MREDWLVESDMANCSNDKPRVVAVLDNDAIATDDGPRCCEVVVVGATYMPGIGRVDDDVFN